MTYNCDECEYSTPHRQNWYKHIKTKKHIELVSDKETHHCKECNYSTDKRQYWYKHIKSSRHEKNILVNKQLVIMPEEDNIRKYQCEECNYSTNKRQYWYSHTKTDKHKENVKNAMYMERYNPIKAEVNSNTERDRISTSTDPDFFINLCNQINDGDDIIDNISISDSEISIERSKQKKINNGMVVNRNNIVINYVKENKVENSNNTTTIENNTTNNIQNNVQNIQVNNYGNEDLKKHITMDTINQMNKLKNEPSNVIDYLMNSLYLEVPEHNNIVYTNMGSKHCKVKTDQGLKVVDVDDTFKERADKLVTLDQEMDRDLKKKLDFNVLGNMSDFLWDGSQMNINEFKNLFMPKKKDPKYQHNKEQYKNDMKQYYIELKVIKEYRSLKRKYMQNLYNLNSMDKK